MINAAAMTVDIGLEVGVVLAQIMQQAGEHRRSPYANAATERLRQFRDGQQMLGEPLPVPFVPPFRRVRVEDGPPLLRKVRPALQPGQSNMGWPDPNRLRARRDYTDALLPRQGSADIIIWVSY